MRLLSGQIPYLEHLVRRLSGGRLGVLDLAGLPSIELTVTRHESGLPRTTPLLYVPYRDAYLLVGSNWGQRQHPAWSINLLHTDKAAVHQNGERFDVTVTHLDRSGMREAVVRSRARASRTRSRTAGSCFRGRLRGAC